jgi:biopolymer transport protein ExbD
MAVKISGADFKAFYTDPAFWPGKPGDTYHEEEETSVDGVSVDPSDFSYSTVADDAILTIRDGLVSSTDKRIDGRSFEAHVKNWVKKQSTERVVVEFDKSRREEIVAALQALGAKVL